MCITTEWRQSDASTLGVSELPVAQPCSFLGGALIQPSHQLIGSAAGQQRARSIHLPLSVPTGPTVHLAQENKNIASANGFQTATFIVPFTVFNVGIMDVEKSRGRFNGSRNALLNPTSKWHMGSVAQCSLEKISALNVCHR